MPLTRPDLRSESGVTLVEVLVVLGILAAIAGVGVQAFTSVDEDAREQLARRELTEIADAMRRFRHDTGYWPKQGAFGADDDDDFAHPANMAQLLFQPVAAGAVDISPYDPASGAGWNGPYVAELEGVLVSVGALGPDGAGDPATGALVDVAGIGDPFARGPDAGVGAFEWVNAAGDQLRLGRPFLYFIDAGAAANVTGCVVPCLVSLGPDGGYDAGGGDDVVVPLGALN